MSGDTATGSPEPAPATESAAAPATHWRRRPRRDPMAAGHAERQGDITHRAFTAMGRDEAIRFLNTEHDALGGRPIALATQSDAGKAAVMAELDRLQGLSGG